MIPIEVNNKAIEKHWEMISPSILKRITDVLEAKKIRKGTGKSKKYYTLSTEMKNFLNSIKGAENLQKYLQADAMELMNKIDWFEKNLSSGIHREQKNVKSMYSDYYILYSIFVDHGYSNESFEKLEFIKAMNIDTCPYCNRNYIYSLHKKGKIKPEIDHFYPKGIYPFLAASFYNLIPSCQTCNGFGGKGAEDTYVKNVTSPYLLNHTDFLFSYKPVSMSYVNPISAKGSIEVILRSKHSQNVNLFKLDKLYNQHEDHVLELIIKSQLEYSKEYRKYLNEYDGLCFSNEEVDRMIVGNYTSLNELHKRPLSKLYRDIAIEEGLIPKPKKESL